MTVFLINAVTGANAPRRGNKRDLMRLAAAAGDKQAEAAERQAAIQDAINAATSD